MNRIIFLLVLTIPFLGFSIPVRGNLGARGDFFVEHESGPIPKGYTERSVLVVTNYQRGLVGIDSGIYCPAEGNVWVECDYVQKKSTYGTMSGLFPISGNVMGWRAYGYREAMFLYGQYDTSTFKVSKSEWNFYSTPIFVGYGVINEQCVMQINDEIFTHALKGGERGDGNKRFWFGKSGSTWDNYLNTQLGTVRIFLSGTCVFEGIPCSRDSDGKAGYYDLVGKRFCQDQGGIGWMDLEEGE